MKIELFAIISMIALISIVGLANATIQPRMEQGPAPTESEKTLNRMMTGGNLTEMCSVYILTHKDDPMNADPATVQRCSDHINDVLGNKTE